MKKLISIILSIMLMSTVCYADSVDFNAFSKRWTSEIKTCTKWQDVVNLPLNIINDMLNSKTNDDEAKSQVKGPKNHATFITKVYDGIDENGNSILAVQGYKNGESIEYKCENMDKGQVKLGSLVVPKIALNGDVKSFKVCDSTGKSVDAFGKNKTSNSGIVTNVNSKKSTITIEGIGQVKIRNYTNVYIYNERLKRSKALTNKDIDYFDYDEEFGLFIDKDNTHLEGKVTAYLFVVDEEIADIVLYVEK